MSPILLIVLLLLLARAGAEAWLEALNRRHVRDHQDELPPALKGFYDLEKLRRSADYTVAKSRFHDRASLLDLGILILALGCGVLPLWLQQWITWFGNGALAQAGWLMGVAWILQLPSLPMSWRRQFVLEARFGFNTTTPRTWWLDLLKGWVLGALLGLPLLWLLLWLYEQSGPNWWLWAWGAFMGFQLLMLVLAPVFILPLFNKFTPLENGPLRDRLNALAQRTGFQHQDLQVMDGSRRSRHSNAFFTGLGRHRRIVLFDTLVEQLGPEQLEAVLAHEIGHWKRRHIPQFIVLSALGTLAGFFALGQLAQWPPFPQAFGFAFGPVAPIFLLFALLSGTITFWLEPFQNRLSRRFEYEADAFAAEHAQAGALLEALRILHAENLGNPHPHPAYSRFHYSHPTLLEREAALHAVTQPSKAKEELHDD